MSLKVVQGFYGEVFLNPTVETLDTIFFGGSRFANTTLNVGAGTESADFLEASQWDLTLTIDRIPWDTVQKIKSSPGSDPFYMRTNIYGMVQGTASIKGYFNSYPGQVQTGDVKRIRMGIPVLMALYHRYPIGYVVGGVISSISTSSNIGGVSNFDFTVDVEFVEFKGN